MKKPISAMSAKNLLLIALLSYGICWVIGGIIGDIFGTFGFICLALGIVRLISEVYSKKRGNGAITNKE